jgi:hypothetical protein
VLPPRAAKLAVPVLGGIAAAGLLLLAARSPQPVSPSRIPASASAVHERCIL